jgi:hypothetical protein
VTFSSVLSLNIFCMHLGCITFLSVTIICWFHLFLVTQRAYMFHPCFFSFVLYLHLYILTHLRCLLTLIFCLISSSILERLSAVFFIWIVEAFILRISIWVFVKDYWIFIKFI